MFRGQPSATAHPNLSRTTRLDPGAIGSHRNFFYLVIDVLLFEKQPDLPQLILATAAHVQKTSLLLVSAFICSHTSGSRGTTRPDLDRSLLEACFLG